MQTKVLWAAVEPEEVLEEAQDFAVTDWPHGGNVERSRHLGVPGDTFTIAEPRGFFPRTALGWIFNLGMIVLTLGTWALIYFGVMVWLAGESHKEVSVQAIKVKSGTKIVMSYKSEEWGAAMEDRLRLRFPKMTARIPERG